MVSIISSKHLYNLFTRPELHLRKCFRCQNTPHKGLEIVAAPTLVPGSVSRWSSRGGRDRATPFATCKALHYGSRNGPVLLGHCVDRSWLGLVDLGQALVKIGSRSGLGHTSKGSSMHSSIMYASTICHISPKLVSYTCYISSNYSN